MAKHCQHRISTETVMQIFGLIHLAFGVSLILHQAGCQVVSWAYYNYNMFEDIFKPGFWLGGTIFLLGVFYFYQHKFPRPALHRYNIAYTVIVMCVCVFFMVFKVRFILRDPEQRTFEDCEAGRWPKSFIMDDKPHCLALKMNNSFGQSMLAFASADIIACISGLVLMSRTKYQFETFHYTSANIRTHNIV